MKPFLLAIFLISQMMAQSPLLLRHATVVDVAGGKLLPDQDVLIVGRRIAAISKHPLPARQVPEGAEEHDATGQYLSPGWIDSHVHFFQSGGLYTRPDAIDLRNIRSYEAEMAATEALRTDFFHRYLAAGITSVVDVGGPMSNFEVRKQADTLAGEAPRVFATGPLISTYVPPALMVEDAPIRLAKTPEEGRALVQAQLPYRPDFIKIWFIVFPDEDPADATAMVAAVIDESHRHGLKVAVHATELATARLAVSLGADVLVHSVQDKEVDEAFARELKQKGVFYMPTLLVGKGYDQTFRAQPAITPADLALAQPGVLGSLPDLKHLPGEQIPGWVKRFQAMPAATEAEIALMSSNLRKLHEAGVAVVSGTDAGNIGTQHASSLFAEWEAMAAAGLSPADILRASTMVPANMLGQKDSLGQVKTGFRADLVLLKVNPLEQVPAHTDLLAVVAAGKMSLPADHLDNSPEAMAQRQLNAYNARDLDAFVACYAEDVEIYQFPGQLMSKGCEAMREGYGPMFEQATELHCELVSRMVLGKTVVDRERVTGFGPGVVLHAIAIYEVENGLIQKVYFIQE